MKRMMIGALLALALILGSQQRASAWVKGNFSVGLNWTVEGGGNCFFWGLWRSAPLNCPYPYPYPGLANHGYGYPWAGAGQPGGADGRTPLLARRRAANPNAPGAAVAPNVLPAAPAQAPGTPPPAITTTPTTRQVGYTNSQPQTTRPYSYSSGVVGYGTPGFQAPSYWYGD